jgi:dienelactone hydrolase
MLADPRLPRRSSHDAAQSFPPRAMIALPPVPPAVQAEAPIVSADPVILPAVGARRRLLLRVTAPATGRGLPVIVLTHGNRLSREDYRPLVEWWARAGFVVVQPDHEDASTDGFWPASIPAGMWRTRIDDVRRTIDALPRIAQAVPGLAGRIDVRRIAVAGHSLGGYTAEAIAGATLEAGAPQAFSDPRVRATILLAPPGRYEDMTPAWQARAPYLKVDFGTMRGPLLVVGGAADGGDVLSPRDWTWRTDAYTLAAPGTACLMLVAGAGHYLGGINGPAMKPDGDAKPERLGAVRDATVRFLDATLRDGPADWRGPVEAMAGRPGVAAATCR